MLLSDLKPARPTLNPRDPLPNPSSRKRLGFSLIMVLLAALLLIIAVSATAGPVSANYETPMDTPGWSSVGTTHPSVSPDTGNTETPLPPGDFLDDVTLWSATLTPRTFPETLTFTGYSSQHAVGALDDAVFVADGHTYTINVLALSPIGNALGIRISPDLDALDTSSWILLVDGREFAVADAGVGFGYEENETLVVWEESGLSWKDGQQVSLRLIDWQPGTCPVGEGVDPDA